MFFALDIDAETSFTDVAQDHPYYAYIASGENRKIIKGFEGNAFKGDLNVTKEQVLAFCSRILTEELGVSNLDDIEAFLNYMDKNTISNWAKKAIALTVQEGLIEEGGMLYSANDITRVEAAEILHNLFNRLYIKYPTTLSVTADAEETDYNYMIGGGTIGFLSLVGVAGYVYYKKKRKV